MAFGGGGPLHACALAADLGIPTVIVPRHPGLFSALGLLAADVRATFSRSLVAPLDAATLGNARLAAAALLEEARAALVAQGVAAGAVRTVVELDVRYAGQSFDLTVPLAGDVSVIAEAFHARHERRYGYAARDERVELATVRVTALGSGGRAPHATLAANGGGAAAACLGTRDAWDGDRFVAAAVYERERLGAGARIEGPAIVEQYDTTTWLATGWHAVTDPAGNLVLQQS
jgi:N-methylhydantoinase A